MENRGSGSVFWVCVRAVAHRTETRGCEPERKRERGMRLLREKEQGSWVVDVRHFRGSGGLPRERAFVRGTSYEGEIGCTRVEGEIFSCNIFYLIVKFACSVEASLFLVDPHI